MRWNRLSKRYPELDWLETGARVQEANTAPRLRRHGTITHGMWGGYVHVQWDNGAHESGVHIRDIAPETPS